MAGIDHFAICADQTFDIASPAYGFNVFATHQHRAVFDDRELA
jgi:hypothetical protein